MPKNPTIIWKHEAEMYAPWIDLIVRSNLWKPPNKRKEFEESHMVVQGTKGEDTKSKLRKQEAIGDLVGVDDVGVALAEDDGDGREEIGVWPADDRRQASSEVDLCQRVDGRDKQQRLDHLGLLLLRSVRTPRVNSPKESIVKERGRPNRL